MNAIRMMIDLDTTPEIPALYDSWSKAPLLASLHPRACIVLITTALSSRNRVGGGKCWLARVLIGAGNELLTPMGRFLLRIPRELICHVAVTQASLLRQDFGGCSGQDGRHDGCVVGGADWGYLSGELYGQEEVFCCDDDGIVVNDSSDRKKLKRDILLHGHSHSACLERLLHFEPLVAEFGGNLPRREKWTGYQLDANWRFRNITFQSPVPEPYHSLLNTDSFETLNNVTGWHYYHGKGYWVLCHNHDHK